jgi:hypothetical protein
MWELQWRGNDLEPTPPTPCGYQGMTSRHQRAETNKNVFADQNVFSFLTVFHDPGYY